MRQKEPANVELTSDWKHGVCEQTAHGTATSATVTRDKRVHLVKLSRLLSRLHFCEPAPAPQRHFWAGAPRWGAALAAALLWQASGASRLVVGVAARAKSCRGTDFRYILR